MTKHLITTLGPLAADDVGVILPHEHVFVDLRTPDTPGYAEAEPGPVIALMKPEIDRARQSGITAIVEASPIGVGRRVDLLQVVSRAADYPLVVPTGVYREPWIPEWVHSASEDELYRWMRGELADEIEGTGVRAGWIKLSAGDDGLTATETRVLRAAARAAAEVDAAIGSHTIRGCVVRQQLDIVEEMGYTAQRFIWIHTQAEPDADLHLEIARRGAWLEYDGIGGEEDDFYIDRITRVLDAGFSAQVLLSQDRGWYDPAQPDGGTPRPFTYLVDVFLPRLRAAGVSAQMLEALTVENPFQAFAR
jgi:phosphotriesterase-related protein